MRTKDNHVFTRAEDGETPVLGGAAKEDELNAICDTHAVEVAKMVEPANKKRERRGIWIRS